MSEFGPLSVDATVYIDRAFANISPFKVPTQDTTTKIFSNPPIVLPNTFEKAIVEPLLINKSTDAPPINPTKYVT